MATDRLAITHVARQRHQCHRRMLSQMDWLWVQLSMTMTKPIILLPLLSGFLSTGSVDGRRGWLRWGIQPMRLADLCWLGSGKRFGDSCLPDHLQSKAPLPLGRSYHSKYSRPTITPTKLARPKIGTKTYPLFICQIWPCLVTMSSRGQGGIANC